MATIALTRNYADGEIYTQADVDAPYDDIETFINVTKLNDDNIQNNGITGSTKLLTGSVTEGKLASNSVSTVKIVDQAVTEDKIADDAVTTVKILDDAVTTLKIVDDAITTDKILDANVTRAKLADDVRNDSLPTVQTTTYSVDPGDDYVRVDTTSAGFTVTMFANGATNSGRILKIQKLSGDFNVCTIAGFGGETINSAASTTINTAGEIITLEYDGISNWIITNRYIPSVWASATFGVTGGFTGITSQASFIRRVGDSLHCKVEIVLSGTSAASGTITLPSGISIDTGKVSSQRTQLGTWYGLNLNNIFTAGSGSTEAVPGFGVIACNTSSPGAVYPSDRGNGAAGLATVTTINGHIVGGEAIVMDFTIPVSGWNG